MFDRVTSTRHTLDYPGVAGLMCREHAFPPIPSERIMPLAEFLTSQGRFSLIGGVGALVGEARVTAWVERHGSWLTVSRRDIERAKGRLDRHGRTAVCLCRRVPGIRSRISIPTGFVRMPLTPFLGDTALGTGVWAALLAYPGRLLGARDTHVETVIGPVFDGVLGLLVAWWVVWVVTRRRAGGPRGEGS
jgi:membrane protein DedA with SNARE-associated domain